MDTTKMPEYDFISSMPDVILHHVLSFLDVREAVQTCILSKRWINLWRTLPFLYFEGSHFVKDTNFPLEEDVRRLEHFVSMVLLGRDPCPLLRFHLNCLLEFATFECRDVNAWIRYAVRHNVRELHINVCASNLVAGCILTCTSLEKFNLCFGSWFRHGKYRFKDSEVIKLPNLTELVLLGVELDKNFVKQLFSGCPLLQDLTLSRCTLRDVEVSSSKLKHLFIVADSVSAIRKINAPNLISFWFFGPSQVLRDTIYGNISSLVVVRVYFDSLCDYGALYKFFARISSVEKLELVQWSLPYLFEEQPSEFPLFNNLKNFTLGGCFCIYCHFELVTKFLELTPSLQKLTLEQHGNSPKKCQCNWEESTSYGRQTIDAVLKCKNLREVIVKYMKFDVTIVERFCAWSVEQCN